MDVTNWNGITGLGRMGEALNNVRDARLMHLGCGKDVFPGWLNVDLQPTESVLSVDLDALGDAFADLPESSFDGFYGAIYSSICRTA